MGDGAAGGADDHDSFAEAGYGCRGGECRQGVSGKAGLKALQAVHLRQQDFRIGGKRQPVASGFGMHR